LSPLSFSDCEKYIAKRLEIAGGNMSLFSNEAIEAVYNYSAGIPRLINILCDNGLLAAYAVQKKRVDRDMIEGIAQDLQLTTAIRPSAPAKESAIGPRESSHPLLGDARSHRPETPNNNLAPAPMAVLPREGIQLSDGATTFEPPNAPGVSTASSPTSPAELVSIPGPKTETIPVTNPIRPSAPAKEAAIGPRDSSDLMPREAKFHRSDPPNNSAPARSMAVLATEGIQI
jgi:hypothetical protein